MKTIYIQGGNTTMGKWYKILGISKDLLEAWKDDLREDVVVWEKNDDVHIRIRLNWLEAIHMRLSMMRINLKQPVALRLVKLKKTEEF